MGILTSLVRKLARLVRKLTKLVMGFPLHNSKKSCNFVAGKVALMQPPEVNKTRDIMRKTVILLLLLLAGLTACTDGHRTYRIGVAQCSEGRWRNKVNQEMLAAQHLYDEDAEVVIAQSFDDTELQIRQIDSLARTGIDLLVVAPNEAAPLAEAISRMRQQGIPVIYFDRRAATDDYTAFIGGNNTEAGRAMGQYVAQLAAGRAADGQKTVVLEITGAMSSTPAQERHQGFAEAMKGHTELDYISREADWTSDEACRIATEYISGQQPSDAGRLDRTIVFCHNDGMATGVYKAVVETGTEGRLLILGIDGMPGEGLEYVQLGHQVGTYIYPTHGEQIVKLALDILTGRPYERDNELRGALVTPENVDIMAATATELMQQSGDLVTIQDKLEQYLGLYNTQRKVLLACFVAIALLMTAVALTWRAVRQMRRALHDRQAMNEEQTLFLTNPAGRTLRQVFETPQEQLPPPRSQDAIFAETLNEAIRKNLSNPALKMDELGETVGLSRIQLYRKVKAITGLTPVELLRQMRLQQGYVLLTSSTKTIAEIAYEVGFGTPAYFSKCFRQQYGKYPSDLRAEQGSQ